MFICISIRVLSVGAQPTLLWGSRGVFGSPELRGCWMLSLSLCVCTANTHRFLLLLQERYLIFNYLQIYVICITFYGIFICYFNFLFYSHFLCASILSISLLYPFIYIIYFLIYLFSYLKLCSVYILKF